MRIIAEVGLNHCGSKTEALYLVNKLLETDIDGITFQIKKNFFYKNVRKFFFNNYKKFLDNVREKNFYLEMKKNKKFISLELDLEFYQKIIKLVKKKNKLIGFAIGDIKKLNFLSNCGADFFKILSEDFWDMSLITAAINSNASFVYLSTGLNSIKDIIKLLKKIKKNKIILIHTRFEKTISKNELNKIPLLNSSTNLPIAFSNHCSNYKIYEHLSKFNLNDLLFYVKNYKKRYYPDDEHAISIKKVNNHIIKLKKLYE